MGMLPTRKIYQVWAVGLLESGPPLLLLLLLLRHLGPLPTTEVSNTLWQVFDHTVVLLSQSIIKRIHPPLRPSSTSASMSLHQHAE